MVGLWMSGTAFACDAPLGGPAGEDIENSTSSSPEGMVVRAASLYAVSRGAVLAREVFFLKSKKKVVTF